MVVAVTLENWHCPTCKYLVWISGLSSFYNPKGGSAKCLVALVRKEERGGIKGRCTSWQSCRNFWESCCPSVSSEAHFGCLAILPVSVITIIRMIFRKEFLKYRICNCFFSGFLYTLKTICWQFLIMSRRQNKQRESSIRQSNPVQAEHLSQPHSQPGCKQQEAA